MNELTTLTANNFSLSIGKKKIVSNISLNIQVGDWLCIIGANGAGKSTLLKGLAGLVAHEGHLSINGIDLQSLSIKDRACWIAYVAQNPTMPPGMRVWDYVMLGRTAHLSVFAKETDRDEDMTKFVIDRLNLHDFVNREVDTLSGGERQRVSLARALAQASPIVLLDEPTSALDVGYQQEVLEVIDELRRDKKIAVITTMHDLTVTGLYPDHIMLMHHGEMMTTGSAADVLTAENIKTAYGADVRVINEGHGPVIIPVRN